MPPFEQLLKTYKTLQVIDLFKISEVFIDSWKPPPTYRVFGNWRYRFCMKKSVETVE